MSKLASDSDFIPKHWCVDGRDSWQCAGCGWITYDDTKLNDDDLCEECEEPKLKE